MLKNKTGAKNIFYKKKFIYVIYFFIYAQIYELS